MTGRSIASEELAEVLEGYALGPLLTAPEPGGGTANASLLLETAEGRFFLKRRNPKYSNLGYVSFDHRLMEHLRTYGLVTPLAIRSRTGDRWLDRKGSIYEIFPYQPGVAHDRRSLAQLAEAGRSLAAFHRASAEFVAPPGKEWPRYHDPDRIREGVEMMSDALKQRLGTKDYAYLQVQIDHLECDYTLDQYDELPKLVVHGDYHPANVLYQGDKISGIFDLDWATVQPRLLDIADGIFLFAGERDSDTDPSDIVSLTQTWRPSIERTRAFLEAYRETEVVTPDEWDALDLAIRARWLFCRVEGRVKLPEECRAEYVTDGLLAPLRALDEALEALW